eukprot:5945939-Prymnesium_polylepis.1
MPNAGGKGGLWDSATPVSYNSALFRVPNLGGYVPTTYTPHGHRCGHPNMRHGKGAELACFKSPPGRRFCRERRCMAVKI